MPTISVIIPLREGEKEHHKLLVQLPDDMEVILSSEASRAESLNAGAKNAKGEYLWFLHADSRLDYQDTESAILALYTAIKRNENSIFYFDLAFYSGKSLMWINALGANLRSYIFKSPFGDQGLFIRKDLFEKLGGFPEDAEYGEDYLFVKNACKQNIKIKPIRAKIFTSARKYQQNGWLKTTLLHQYLWWKL